MTVAQELRKITGYHLLHNHMVIDLVTEFVEFDSPAFHRLAWPLWQGIIEECAQQRAGLIVTFGPYFMRDHHEEWSAPYRASGMRVCYVELSAPIDVRIGRNTTANRLQHKNVSWATPEVLRAIDQGNANVGRDWVDKSQFILIDNRNVPPDDAASMIKDRFNL